VVPHSVKVGRALLSAHQGAGDSTHVRMQATPVKHS
jgi:hypothetical protein